MRPVNALSSEMTIGTSAPPTGSTNSTPTRERHQAEQHQQPRATTSPSRRRRTTPTAEADGDGDEPPKSHRPPGKTTGRLVISSCSLANVTPTR